MKRVEVDEFKHQATYYLVHGEALEIERGGKPIGYYLPIPERAEEEKRAAMERFECALERFLAESGLTEEELSAALDLNRPFDAAIESDAAGR